MPPPRSLRRRGARCFLRRVLGGGCHTARKRGQESFAAAYRSWAPPSGSPTAARFGRRSVFIRARKETSLVRRSQTGAAAAIENGRSTSVGLPLLGSKGHHHKPRAPLVSTRGPQGAGGGLRPGQNRALAPTLRLMTSNGFYDPLAPGSDLQARPAPRWTLQVGHSRVRPYNGRCGRATSGVDGRTRETTFFRSKWHVIGRVSAYLEASLRPMLTSSAFRMRQRATCSSSATSAAPAKIVPLSIIAGTEKKTVPNP